MHAQLIARIPHNFGIVGWTEELIVPAGSIQRTHYKLKNKEHPGVQRKVDEILPDIEALVEELKRSVREDKRQNEEKGEGPSRN